MGRKRVILQSQFPYNISARCINREWFDVPLVDIWQICLHELARTTKDHDLKVHSFVLMDNHFHLIASTPHANISKCMQQFVWRTSRAIAKPSRRINEIFAGRHYKCILHHPNYYLNAYKYNYRNPVTAGICNSVEEYPFSTLKSVMGLADLPFCLAEDSTYIFDSQGTLKWLNETPTPEKLEAFRYGVKRPYFKSNDGADRRPILSEFDRL